MVSLSGKWNVLKNGDALSQKFMGKVKPEAPLKNRLDTAQKKLQLQITRLADIDNKLKTKQDTIFAKIVDAKKSNNETYAKVFANELAEIRKMKNMVSGAKLSMEQVQLRLNTVSELGDVVVTLSPCMSLIKGLSTSLGDMMPSVATSMQDLNTMLGDIVTGSSGQSPSSHAYDPSSTLSQDHHHHIHHNHLYCITTTFTSTINIYYTVAITIKVFYRPSPLHTPHSSKAPTQSSKPSHVPSASSSAEQYETLSHEASADRVLPSEPVNTQSPAQKPSM